MADVVSRTDIYQGRCPPEQACVGLQAGRYGPPSSRQTGRNSGAGRAEYGDACSDPGSGPARQGRQAQTHPRGTRGPAPSRRSPRCRTCSPAGSAEHVNIPAVNNAGSAQVAATPLPAPGGRSGVAPRASACRQLPTVGAEGRRCSQCHSSARACSPVQQAGHPRRRCSPVDDVAADINAVEATDGARVGVQGVSGTDDLRVGWGGSGGAAGNGRGGRSSWRGCGAVGRHAAAATPRSMGGWLAGRAGQAGGADGWLGGPLTQSVLTLRACTTTSLPSSAMATTGPLVMYSMRPAVAGGGKQHQQGRRSVEQCCPARRHCLLLP